MDQNSLILESKILCTRYNVNNNLSMELIIRERKVYKDQNNWAKINEKKACLCMNYNDQLISQAGGPSVRVPLGRKDGLNSSASNVRPNMVDTSFSLDEMARLFSSKGLSLDDLVILSGLYIKPN